MGLNRIFELNSRIRIRTQILPILFGSMRLIVFIFLPGYKQTCGVGAEQQLHKVTPTRGGAVERLRDCVVVASHLQNAALKQCLH